MEKKNQNVDGRQGSICVHENSNKRDGWLTALPRTLYRTSLPAFALKFAHEAGERFDRGRFDRVVKRNAHAAYGAVAGCADQARFGRLFAELFFGGFVGIGCGG